MRGITLLALVALAGASPALAAPSVEDSALTWLEGRWIGNGTSMGQPATATLNVSRALQRKFLELSYSVKARGDRPFEFEGRALYKSAGGGQWIAHWFDSRGVSFPINAQIAGQSLTANWGADGLERGRTTYTLTGDGEIEVVDFVATKAGLKEFARLRYRKAP